MPHLNRRAVLATGAAAIAAPTLARSAPNAELNKLFDQFFTENLRRQPEGATGLGLDKGPNADLRAKLSDQSDKGRADARAATQDQLRRLKALNPAGLSAADRVNYDTVLFSLNSAAASQRFAYGGGGTPYVISQNTGAYQGTPSFLADRHPIETAADADAYLARMEAFAGQLDANTERLRHDAGLGVIPPDFILDTTLGQLATIASPADQQMMVTSIRKRAAEKTLGDRYGRDATRIYDERILPAFARQMDEVKKARTKAVHDAGMWRFKDGPEFYATLLRNSTTTKLSPDEVHNIGLDQARRISAEIDTLLKAQGLTQGSLADRVRQLYARPDQVYPNTDAGKLEAIAYCNERQAQIVPKLSQFFKRLPPYKFEVRRVPPAIEAGAGSAYAQPPTLDGSRPGLVFVNLRDTVEWPKLSLATMIYHEGLPGHQFEGGLSLSNTSLPMIRKTGGFSGYGEGWGLYAEQLADEMGMYENDPLGKIGYLKLSLFRCYRCITDTGIHHKRWSREQAIAAFVDNVGEAPGFVTREVERYCTTPGQAASYKLGQIVIVRLRDRAQKELGSRYDIKDFHEAVLGSGRVPLEVLESVVGDWIASAERA